MPSRPRSRTARPAAAPDTAAVPVRPGASPLHPRNRHQGRYDFPLLLQHDARLQPFVRAAPGAAGEPTIDFADAAAVRALNRALLLVHYGVRQWELPAHSLCPPIPGQADMLHYLADLLAGSNGGHLPPARNICALDIGTGANCIYPLLGASEYGWQFVATDINPASLANAQAILDANPQLAPRIVLRRQTDAGAIFQGVIHGNDWFDLTVCNPPFHVSLAEAQSGTQRKWQNLGKKPDKNPGGGKHAAAPLNFGGQAAELWCAGGERAFILQMIRESIQFAGQCFWFSTLVSKAANLPAISAALKQVKATAVHTIDMNQGQKQSRVVAWTYLNAAAQAVWRERQRA